MFWLNYYKYLHPYEINHYNVINKLLYSKQMGALYLQKYPNAKSFPNLNDELFANNPTAKKEYFELVKKQSAIKKSIINDIKTICQLPNNYKIKTEQFQTRYIEHEYNIDNFDMIIKEVKEDINN
jgi:hypothetical protein